MSLNSRLESNKKEEEELQSGARESRPAGPGWSILRHVESGEREFFIDNRIHFIIVMIRWTGLAPREFEFLFSMQPDIYVPSNLESGYQEPCRVASRVDLYHNT